MKTKTTATGFAILAAALYAINIPFSKLLLTRVSPTMMAAFLYLGAGLGLLFFGLIYGEKENGEPLTFKELPYTIGMIISTTCCRNTIICMRRQTDIWLKRQSAVKSSRNFWNCRRDT